MITRTATAAVVLSALLLGGCGDDDPVASPDPSASAAATGGATPTGATTPGPTAVPTETGPPFPANTLADTEEPAGGPLGVRVARAAGQAGYDRVVIELGGKAAGLPGWRVEYVDTPTSDGSGDPVAVKGSAFLQVLVTGTGYPDDTGVPEPTTRRFSPAGTTVVREVVLDGVFEGQYTAFIGLGAKKPFRVFRLAGPPRVVIDVRHS